MPAWLLPAIFAGASSLLSGISGKKQRDEQNRQLQAQAAEEQRRRVLAQQDYVRKYDQWITDQNKRRALAKWVIEQKGGTVPEGALDPIDRSVLATLPGAPSVGRVPQVKGSFLGDTLGAALGQVPQLISTFRSTPVGRPPSVGSNILTGINAFAGNATAFARPSSTRSTQYNLGSPGNPRPLVDVNQPNEDWLNELLGGG